MYRDFITIYRAAWLVPLVAGCSAVAYSFLPSKAALRPQRYCFDIVREGQDVEHTFVINNPGPKDLNITSVATSCGCILSKQHPESILAGASCALPVVMHTKGQSGKVTQHVVVMFAEHPAVTCTLFGEVLRVVPDKIGFPDLKAGDEYEVEFRLNPIHGEHLDIEKLEYNHFDISYSPDASNNSFKFRVKLKPEIPFGPFDKRLAIHTNDKFSPIKSVPIAGYIMRPIECVPSRVAFGIAAPGQQKTQTLKLHCPYGDATEIDRIETSLKNGLAWKVIKDPADQTTVDVEIQFTPAGTYLVSTAISGDLFIYGHAGQRQVRTDVSLSALVTPAVAPN